jgi:hypothetical protein
MLLLHMIEGVHSPAHIGQAYSSHSHIRALRLPKSFAHTLMPGIASTVMRSRQDKGHTLNVMLWYRDIIIGPEVQSLPYIYMRNARTNCSKASCIVKKADPFVVKDRMPAAFAREPVSGVRHHRPQPRP